MFSSCVAGPYIDCNNTNTHTFTHEPTHTHTHSQAHKREFLYATSRITVCELIFLQYIPFVVWAEREAHFLRRVLRISIFLLSLIYFLSLLGFNSLSIFSALYLPFVAIKSEILEGRSQLGVQDRRLFADVYEGTTRSVQYDPSNIRHDGLCDHIQWNSLSLCF